MPVIPLTVLLRRLAVCTTVLLGLVHGAAPASAASPPPASGYASVGTWQLLAMVNDHRRARGLAPLVNDPRLSAAARQWTEHLARTGSLAHNDDLFTPSRRSALGMRMLGENVGHNGSVAAQHAALLKSPGHRRNIEHPRFTRAGFAVVRGADGRLWTTQDFGLPR